MLYEIAYPIIGQFRGILLVTEWLIIILSLQLGILFMGKYSKRRQANSFRDLSFSFLFFGIALSEFFNYLADFYATLNYNPFFRLSQIETQRMVFIYLSELILMVSGLVFVYIMEQNKQYLIRKYFFTYSFLTILIIWLFLVFVGFIFTTDEMVLMWGLELRVLGGFIQIIGLAIFLYRFNRLPAFSEFNLNDKIEQIYLIEQSGVCLFNKILTSDSDLSKRHLISSAISSINVILNDLTGENMEKGLSTIKKEGKIISIFPGENVFGVIVSNEEIPFSERYLKSFVIKFEKVYSDVLNDWNGDINLFIPVESLAQEIFGLK